MPSEQVMDEDDNSKKLLLDEHQVNVFRSGHREVSMTRVDFRQCLECARRASGYFRMVVLDRIAHKPS